MAKYKTLHKIEKTVIVPDDESGFLATDFIVHYESPVSIKDFINQVHNDEMPSIRVEVLDKITNKDKWGDRF